MVVASLVAVTACASAEQPVAEPTTTTPTIAVPSTTGTTPAPITTTTLPVPPGALAAAPYDNTVATRACTLLAVPEIAAQFGGSVAEPVPIYPYCWWRVADDGFVSLTIYDRQPLATFRAYGGLAVGTVADLGEGAFFASNKTLFVGVGGSTYVLQFERGAEWVDSNQPKLISLARLVLDRLGFVQPPKPPPPTTTTTTAPPNPDDPPMTPVPPVPTTTVPPTTTTTRPKPPVVGPPPAVQRPTALIDAGRHIDAAHPLHLWVGGDSIAGGPAWAVGDAARPTGVAITDTEFQVGTGLARPDFFDWYGHLAAVADARDPDVMILMFGANDIQPMTLADGRVVAHGQPGWLDEYRRRVGLIMDVLAVRGRRVVWVGLPPMEVPAFNQQMAELNEIYASETAKRAPWVTYFDTWTMFGAPGQPGVFTRELPDADGVPRPVRFDDIHYNQHGSEVLAAALLAHVRTFTQLPG